MKLIQHIDGVVVSIRDAHEGITMDGIALADSIPTFEPREGFNGVLMYGENGLYWDYEEAPEPEVSEEEYAEAGKILMGVSE